jgi:hypothetical protein
VRAFLANARYPANKPLLGALGVASDKVAYGLTSEQTRWRIEEVEAAGYDWEASKRLQRLTKR